MKRNRKKSSTRDRARPSTSSKTKEENDLAYFVDDRVTLMREVFSILKPKEIKAITPECVRKLSIDKLEELCLEELLGISSKRLCAVLDGAEPPSDTESSSSNSSSSSESENTEQSSKSVVEEVICLDSESNNSSVKSKKKKNKKKKKKRKRKSTDTTTNSDATVETVSTEQSNTAKQLEQPKNKQNKNNKKTSTNAAILNSVGGKPNEVFSEKARGEETSRAAQRVGMTVLDILEVQARARAIKSQLMKERNNASQPQAGPSTSNTNTKTKEVDASDSEVEIKEESAEVVDLLTSSDDEDEKPNVEELALAVEEPDPPPTATKEKDKTKIKKTKTVNDKTSETLVPDKITKSVPPEKTKESKISDKANKKRKTKQTDQNSVKDVSNKASKRNVEQNPTKTVQNTRNNDQNDKLQFSDRVNKYIKEEDDERENSPDLVILEDSDSEKIANGNSKKVPQINKTTEHSDIQSVVKVIDGPNTTKISKSSHKNDFKITVTQNTQRKVRKDRNNVVISFSNDPNAIESEGDGNRFIVTAENRDRRATSSDIIEQSAKKLNSTVTKIIKERSKRKYLKSVVQKTTDKDEYARTNRKERDKTTNDKIKERNGTEAKDKESDSDEITLQLSDSEKMDLLEDLNPKNLDKVSENSGSDSKSSDSDDSSTSSDDNENTNKTQNDTAYPSLVETGSAKNTEDITSQETDSYPRASPSKKILESTENSEAYINETDSEIKGNDDKITTATNLDSAKITIPKTITNDLENELRKPIKTIISQLREDDMVLDKPKTSDNSPIAQIPEEITNLIQTVVNIALDNNVEDVEMGDFNLTNKTQQDNVNDISQNDDLTTVPNEENSNIIEISSIKDIPILPDYESDYQPEAELRKRNTTADKDVAKEISKNKTRTKLKKSRKKQNRNESVSFSSSDDIVEKNVCKEEDLNEDKGNEMTIENINEIVAKDSEAFEQIIDQAQSNTDKTNINKHENENKTYEQQLKPTIEIDLEKKYCKTREAQSSESKTVDDQIERNDWRKHSITETKENCVASKESNKITSDGLSAKEDVGDDSQVKVATSLEIERELESKDVMEDQPDLEEGEITDDFKRQASEEGEITTETESEIEAQDVIPETICISDEDHCTTENRDDNTKDKTDVENKIKKKSKKKNLCKKCKRKKLLKDPDKCFYRNSDIDKRGSKPIEELTIDESIDIIESDIGSRKSYSPQVNEVSNDNDMKNLVIDSISLDSETDSDSDSNTDDSNTVKTQSKKDKINLKIDKSISNIDLLSPNNNLTDSDTLEILEISDDSSDCYEILSKEPTTEEIEALSEKIDRIDRIEVVTNEEIVQHELSNDSIQTDNITETSRKQNDKKDSEKLESQHSNDTYIVENENISWKDRYIKSKKVTKVLTTANILNALRKKNLDLKKKLLESKIAKPVEEIKKIVQVVPEMVEIGSIDHYNTLESGTKYVDPVKELSNPETEAKDTNLTSQPEATKTPEQEILVKPTTETQAVTKEMKKDAKKLLKMYKKLIKHNNMFKEKDPSKKKKKKKKSKKKDGVASSSSVVTENI